jgi:hypothetical protein
MPYEKGSQLAALCIIGQILADVPSVLNLTPRYSEEGGGDTKLDRTANSVHIKFVLLSRGKL